VREKGLIGLEASEAAGGVVGVDLVADGLAAYEHAFVGGFDDHVVAGADARGREDVGADAELLAVEGDRGVHAGCSQSATPGSGSGESRSRGSSRIV